MSTTGTPKCKHHPDKGAVLRHDGRSTGLCPACLSERGKKGGKGRS
jgi:hypothetical protein